MKRNVLSVALIIITIFSLIHAFIKADEAEKNKKMTLIVQQEAEQWRDEAVELQNKAMLAAAEAKRQEAISLELADQLSKCQSK